MGNTSESLENVKPNDDAHRWEVQIPGAMVRGLHYRQLSAGLREGWLRLDDPARCGEEEWKPLREAAKDVFGVSAFVDTARAYGGAWGLALGVGLALVNAVVSFLVAATSYLGLSLGEASVVMLIVLVAFPLMAKSPNFIVTGLLAVAAGFAINAMADRAFTFVQIAGIVLGGYLGLLLAGGIGFVVGYGVAFPFGYLTGRLLRGRYTLPQERAPVPVELAGPSVEKSVGTVVL